MALVVPVCINDVQLLYINSVHWRCGSRKKMASLGADLLREFLGVVRSPVLNAKMKHHMLREAKRKIDEGGFARLLLSLLLRSNRNFP